MFGFYINIISFSQNNLLFWSAGKVWIGSGALSWFLDGFLRPSSLLGIHCWKIPLLNDWFFTWLPSLTCCLFRLVIGVFNLDSREVFRKFFVRLVSCGKVFCIPSTSCKISEFFVSIFHVSAMCFSLSARGNLETCLAENNFLIIGCTFSNSLHGIICENYMLKKVSFLFVFAMFVAACLSIYTKNLLLFHCTRTILLEKEFLRPSRALPRCFWWVISKGFLVFLPL